jgi:HK97 family phage prohead protease
MKPRPREHYLRREIALRLRDGLPVDHLAAELHSQQRWSAEIEKRRALAAKVDNHVRVSCQIETRAAKAGRQYEFTGYASTTERPYRIGGANGYTETIARGAFVTTLSRNPDVNFNLNHGADGGVPLARTTNGTLSLREDDIGLRFVARVDGTRYPRAKEIANAIEDGLLSECSFAFKAVRSQWSDDWEERRILECDLDAGDCSVVVKGANSQTPVTVSARSAQADGRSADYWIATATALRMKGLR